MSVALDLDTAHSRYGDPGIARFERCRVCGRTDTVEQYPNARDYVTGHTFKVMECLGCKVSFTAPCPEDMEPYYPKTYRRYTEMVIFILKSMYKLKVRRWAKLFDRPGKALEVGCGDGFMLQTLKELGWDVAGIERTDEMAAYARERFGIKVFTKGFEEIPSGAEFDLIILFQVLEHMSSPLEVLEQCRRLLKPGGKIVIGVPNFESWQSKYAGAEWFHLDAPRHLSHFSPRSLENALGMAGLSVQRINFISFEHDPFGWLQSILNKRFGNRNTLTKLLMRSKKWGRGELLLPLGVLALGLPSVLLSLTSWLFGKGAIMEVICRRNSGQHDAAASA